MNFYEIIKGLYSEDIHIVCRTINESQHIKTLIDYSGNAIHTGFVCKSHTNTIFEFIYLIQNKCGMLCRQVLLPECRSLPPLGTILEYKPFSGKEKGSFLIKQCCLRYSRYSNKLGKFVAKAPFQACDFVTSDDSITRCILKINPYFHFKIDADNLLSYPLYNCDIHEFYLSGNYTFSIKKSHSNIFIDDTNDSFTQSYCKYSGTYAQDVEGCSDEFIDDALDGHPDAYWNID